jgi:serine/threonine protein kinase/tetratricopeptide (TPR) repeat protein
LAWNGRWEPRATATADVVLELTPGSHGLVVTQARPEVQVNGQPWQAPIPLGPGDKIRFGAGGVEVLSIGSTVGGSHLNSQSQTQSASGSSLDPSLGSGSSGSGGRVAAPSVGSQLGRYLLQEPLGSGQFGTVFRAQDTQLGREVALKLLVRATERAQQRFIREVQATAKLQHPNLVTTYDGGEMEGWLYLAMEVVIGRTLREAGRDPSVSRDQKIRWIAQSARAVAYVNGAGVLHRDLKPSNIMIDGEGQARVVDFGMAGIESEETQRLTKTGAALGTPAYMAPEVLYKGGQEAGSPSEVYSLGASLYSLLTGRSPREQFNEEPKPFGDVAPEEPSWLVEAVERAMATKPEERFPDADGFAAALEAGLSEGAPAKGGPPLLALGGVVVLLALGGIGAFVATRGPAETPAASASTPTQTPGQSETPATSDPSPSASKQVPERSPAERAAAARQALLQGRTQRTPWKDLAAEVAALEEATGALEESPERAAGTRLLLQLYLERRRLSQLRKKVGETASFAQQKDLLAAQIWRALDERERALACLQAAAGESPESTAERAAAALRALWLGSPEVAHAALPSLPDKASSPDAYRDLAWIAAKANLLRGDRREALAWLALAPPEEVRVEAVMVRALSEADHKAAFKLLEPLVALQQETSPEAAGTLAHLANLAGAPRVALTWLDKIPRDRLTPGHRALRGRALQIEGRAEEAQRALEEADAADPILAWRTSRSFPKDTTTTVWSETDRWAPQGALPLHGAALPSHLDEATRSLPSAAKADLREALELSYQGDELPLVVDAIRAALEAAPADPTVLIWSGRLLLGRDRFSEALEVLERAREADPEAKDTEVERLEAELWLRRGQVDVARRRYAAAGKGDSRAALVARCELGWLQGAAQEGEKLGLSLVEAHPDHAPGWLALAVNQINLGKREQALASLERAIQLEGGINARALMFRALLLARAKGQPRDRYGAFEQTFRLTEGASPRILAASVALTRREVLPWIQSELSRARAHEPQRPELYLWLGVAGIQVGERHPSGRQAEVDRLWRELLRLEPGFRIPQSVAKAYQRRFGAPFRK